MKFTPFDEEIDVGTSDTKQMTLGSNKESLRAFVASCKNVVEMSVYQRYYDRLELEPNNPTPIYELAELSRRTGDSRLWYQGIEVALTMPHDSFEAIYERGRAKLTLGDWSGWYDIEARRHRPESHFRSKRARQLNWTHRRWRNALENIHDLTVLVLLEQGFGDAIQMLRFLPMVASRAKQVVASVRPELVSLVQYNFGDRVNVVFDNVELPLIFDRYVWSMSLPALLGALPNFSPLRAPQASGRIALGDRWCVGVCWAGSPSYQKDGHRSMPVEYLEPLFKVENVQWFNLQVGDRAGEGDTYRQLIRPPTEICSFADTADFIANLDIVVSVDTAVCHLAGSLGVPTFLLLPTAGNWRWALSDTTPWYPSVRILRQRTAGDWTGVVAELIDAIAHRTTNSASTRNVYPTQGD